MKKNYIYYDLLRIIRKGITLTCSVIVSILFFNNAKAQSYCSNPANTIFGADIGRVKLGTLNNTSNCSSVGGTGSILKRFNTYTASVAAPTLVAGSGLIYPLSVSVIDCDMNPQDQIYVYVWIDYNNDGDFLDANETVFDSGQSWVNYTIGNVVEISAPGGMVVPTGVTPGTKRMRVIVSDYSLSDACDTYFRGETEEYRVVIALATPCSGSPAANLAVINPSSSAFCTNSNINLSTLFTYTNSGITYIWQSSTTSSVGPFTNITNANANIYSTSNLPTNTWYRVVATCSSAPISMTSAAVQANVVPTTTSTVPYFEGFEGSFSNTNELPNCSWTRSSPLTCVTSTNTDFLGSPKSGNGYAYIHNGVCGSAGYDTSYFFYSNGIFLNAGVTYSASVWYNSDNVDKISLKYGTSQSSTSLNSIADVSYPASNDEYIPLGNTFTVSSSGIYYIALQVDMYSCQNYALFDDLSITIPCTIASNSVNITISAPNFVCAGQVANMIASGASTYNWSGGINTASYSTVPTYNTTYTVIGTNSLSGCSSSATKYVEVQPIPYISILSNKNSLCVGSSLDLTAIGSAYSYTWNTGAVNSDISVSPTVTTTYTVQGTGASGCVNSVSKVITVNALPTINVAGSRTICLLGGGNFSASGANNYLWSSAEFYLQGTTVKLTGSELGNIPVTVMGTDANNCVSIYTFNLVVDACTGIMAYRGNERYNASVFPNPNNGAFTVALENGLSKTIDVVDMTGRNVFSTTTTEDAINLNIEHLSNGVYHVKVKSNNVVEVLKVVKQ